MAKSNSNEEPSTAPQPDRWYNLALGPSFKDHRHPSPKFCTLRYDFKPASIDKNQSGSLHKIMDNRVTVEFQNNQPGKPKVSFEGTCEDYKESDALLFFDGQTFRLERLHRAVKRLRHVRLPGESAAVTNLATTASVGATAESYSPPLGKRSKVVSLNNDVVHQIPAEVERTAESLDASYSPSHPNPLTSSPDSKDCELEEDIDIVNDNEDDFGTAENENLTEMEFNNGFDINLPHPADMDDEIAEVDVSDDVMDKGPNAAEALRAQVNAEAREKEETSSTNSSSGSGSGSGSRSRSGSRSGSSGGDSESSDGDSVISI
ncbi:ELL-associated factor 2 [Juglans microcarpa x Juglans regia]|uniref:ELL-associated factor 2 n=1 Tax=Juglans microcarpa x Juglans regia TaxID=2249226 RepID=UPI001B7DF38C|nr:ELL-associated factor 2 [Juglans microcarpa x Juglans regia]